MDYVVTFIASCVSLPVLPLYFLMAGYLMFDRFDTFGLTQYRYVVTRRLLTLVAPWLLWTVIGYACFALLDPSRPAPPPWRLDLIMFADSYSQPLVVSDSLSIPLLGTPFGCGVMYYARDIFILALISPLIWLTVRRLGLWTIPLCVAVYLLIGRPGVGPWRLNWIFFPVGVALSVSRVDLGALCRRFNGLGWTVTILWAAMTVVYTWMCVNYDFNHLSNGFYARNFGLLTTLTGIAAVVWIAHRATLRRNPRILALAPIAFLIFAIHVLPPVEKPLVALADWFNDFLGVADEWKALSQTVCLLPIRVLLIATLAALIGRVSPRLLSLLTGSRSRRAERLTLNA